MNRGLFISMTGVLLGFGIIMVHSASITSWPTSFERVYVTRHLLFLVLAIASCCLCAKIPASFWWHYSPYIYLATLLLLILVLIPALGTEVNGARRWLRFGKVSLQPSELAKVAFPLLFGRLIIQQKTSNLSVIRSSLSLLPVLGFYSFFVYIEPDLGSTLFLVLSALLMLWLSGYPLRFFLLSLFAIIPLVLLVVSLKPYQAERVNGFLSTWRELGKAPYQIRQSLLSFGSGGIEGSGLGKGWQKLSFLPEANTDFVFAVVGEELGLCGTLAVIAVWCTLLCSGFHMFCNFPKISYGYLVGMTLLLNLVIQASINTAVVTAIAPPKGIPHPFLSYGGSSLFTSLVCVGIILSLSKSRPLPPLDVSPKEV